MAYQGRTLIGSAVVPIRFIFLMWLVFVVNNMLEYHLEMFGIWPRTITGSIGIVTGPFLHGGVIHLVSNTFPLLSLGIILFYSYPRLAGRVFYSSYFITNILVWIFARPYNHIGSSGIVYGLASFLIFFGLFRRDFRSLVISLTVLLLYGSIFYGILPVNTQISWESHLAGGIIGFIAALKFKNARI